MTYCDGDIIQLNEDYRLKVTLDGDSENPLEWGWGTEILTIDEYGIHWHFKPTSDLHNLAQAMQWNIRNKRWTPEQRDRAIHLYMVYLGDTRSFEVHEWRGYSQSDWATVLVLWDKEDGSNVYEPWASWRRGDVYTVTEEVRKVYVSPDDADDIYEDWFEGDNLSGCYLEPGYSPEDVARENFDAYPMCDECRTPQTVTHEPYIHTLNCTKREI